MTYDILGDQYLTPPPILKNVDFFVTRLHKIVPNPNFVHFFFVGTSKN